MAELTISADEIQGSIASYVSSFEAGTGREEIGTVIDAGDGIAHVEGLPSVMTQELLEFAGGVLGVALNLDEHSIGAVILGEFEKIELYNVNNGERFSTYAIRGKRGSGEISLNGAAARLAHLGDLLIICTYAPMSGDEVASYKPKVVFVDDKNRITSLKAI
jgi:aspartate 1-decarboxylase